MSWFSKVAWKEGLFLQPHHFQQSDRYFEKLVEARTRLASPYPWGFSQIEIDRDVAQQTKFGLRSATGIFPDGTPFDMPGISQLPDPVEIPEGSEGLSVWLTMPMTQVNGREVGTDDEASRAARYRLSAETVADSTASMRLEEAIEVAHPRVEFDVRKTEKPGYNCLRLAKVVEVRDKNVIFDEKFAPPVLTVQAHPVVAGWIERVVGWVETKLESLARYASDPSSGGGLQATDYFMLLVLNREIGLLRHYRHSRFIHPEELYQLFLRLAGELWTFDKDRLAPEYKPYDQDNLEEVFEPITRDIQRLLSRDVGRAVRLDLQELHPGSFIAKVTDRNLFRDASFVIEVSADKPLTQIQQQFPALCKVGPNTQMNAIVNSALPGLELVHLPTPPRQIRAVSSHVYFNIDKNNPMWREFSTAPAIGMHFAGDWPDLKLELWGIQENR
ncbi:type VI secretion system baseplate subunit TssK [Vannielia sp.]|uniref:type VI secretion system baseplate subunit TssK n=1 Tax=Vannielia sp. TaxID=2813045 RepID=UPI0026297B71|nr:type VI secretion system baseplate subunit TssK [Vannielia sp.]MDF1872447.1 type VI secretion system baseplate subunit TssK [Vannielia sp.]